MNYSRAFFALQIRFAQKLAGRFDIATEAALFAYTPFALHFERQNFAEFSTASDPTEWAHRRWEQRRGPQIEANGTFHGHRLFGRFYFEVRDGHIIRPHLAPVSPPTGLLGTQDRPAVLADLRRMFSHIHAEFPDVDTVLGNSWIYNLPAYCKLFPPIYTHQMQVSQEDEFHYLALWGQFFSRNWQLRQDAAQFLLQQLEELDKVENLLGCFPLQVLMPRGEIQAFNNFYGIE